VKTNDNKHNKHGETSPPKESINIMEWLRQNLFSSYTNTALTIATTILLYLILKEVFYWVFITADWSVIAVNFKILMAGQYPDEELWRVWLAVCFLSLTLGVSWSTWRGVAAHIAIAFIVIYAVTALMPFVSVESKIWLFVNISLILISSVLARKLKFIKKLALPCWILVFPVTIFLLAGFGILPTVPTSLWSGFLLTILLAVVAIVVSFPISVLLAIGRNSNLPLIRYFCIFYIEFIRGIPLITVLFITQLMLPIFLGGKIEIDSVVRAMIGLTMFNAAYLAENIRGGLQSIPRGQYEAASALGLSATITMIFIIMPQALRVVIPAMVGQSISIFKDTSLVVIVGLIDLLGMGRVIISNPEFLGKNMEVFTFIALAFLIFCNMMAYASRKLEEAMGLGKRY